MTIRPEDYLVRRLTPTECARLQGMPDDWCAKVPHKDSAEYKLWGSWRNCSTILERKENENGCVVERGQGSPG